MTARVTVDETTQPFTGRETTPPVSVEELIEVASSAASGPTYVTSELRNRPSTPLPKARRFFRSLRTRSGGWCGEESSLAFPTSEARSSFRGALSTV
jgi:hypothetical protein